MTIESAPAKGTTVRISIPNKVIDPSECMSIRDRDSVSLGAFLHFEKYKDPNVREFYNSMVKNLVTGMKVTMHRVDNVESLHALVDNKRLTHLFAGPEEYNGAVDYMEELAKTVIVTVVANPEELMTPPNTRVRVMPKPFYCFPVVSILNSKITDEIVEEGRILFPGARVLVVDDEPMNLIVSSGMLGRYGMIVSTCDSGQAAIDLCRSNEYDVIFMDHMMPKMDGVEAMKRIRSDMSRGKVNIPIIAFTANAVSSAKEMFRQAGFDGFIGKPVDHVELERVLKRVLPSSLVAFENDTPVRNDTENAVSEKTGTEKSVMDRLNAIGVDTAGGLYYSQNDREFYNTLLAQYAKESDDKKRRMKDALAKNDLDAYSIQVHSIKSTSKMIGAADLSESARLLEQAAKSGNSNYVYSNHDAMMTVYERVIMAIRPEGSDDKEDTPDNDAADEVIEFDPVGDGGEGGR